jgi:hypothetical protein
MSWAHALMARAAEVSPTNSHADFIGISPWWFFVLANIFRRSEISTKNSIQLECAEANSRCSAHPINATKNKESYQAKLNDIRQVEAAIDNQDTKAEFLQKRIPR